MKNAVKPLAPYGLAVIESCLTCVLREEGLFCRLSEPALRELSAIRQTAFYPAGAVLFVEGESPRGLFILCSGEARLSASSKDGRIITLRPVRAGEVLGLSSVIANGAFAVTAEITTPAQVNFIPRADFLHYLGAHPEVMLRVAEHLSMELHKAWEQTRMLALAPNTRAKLAQLLLAWANQHGQPTPDGLRVPFHMTQEQIGAAIGASRETVSRLLSDLKRRRLIRVKGGSVFLLQPEALQALTVG